MAPTKDEVAGGGGEMQSQDRLPAKGNSHTCRVEHRLQENQNAGSILLAAWVILQALDSGSETVDFDVAFHAGAATTRQVVIDWSDSVGKLIDKCDSQSRDANSSSAQEIASEDEVSSTPTSLFMAQVNYSQNRESGKNDHLNTTTEKSYSLLISAHLSKDGRSTVEATFDASIHSQGHITRLLGQHEQLVRCLGGADKNDLLRDLDLIGPDEQALLMEANAIYPPAVDECVHSNIERQAADRPHSPAVEAWDATFSYGELNHLSDRLATYLSRLGVHAETPIILAFDKSAWAAVSMLAVLKAGGAIVMIDPGSSRGAAQRIADTARATIVLTDHHHLTSTQKLVQTAVVVSAETIDGLPPQPSGADLARPPTDPSNTAWIIFTSGSTGTPKGVVLEHRAICTGAMANTKVKHMNEDTRTFGFSSYVFDGAIQDYLFTWYAGGCVCIPSEKERTDDIAGSMRKYRVNWTFLTPSVVSLLSPADVPCLETMALGGEALTAENVKTWSKALTLQNAYGPAECTVACAVGEFPNEIADANNIGYPVGSLLWVCNPNCHDQLVPPGCVGELLVEGPMLARGYLGDPITTAKSFIEEPKFLPMNSINPRRLYKTGDLVRQQGDGSFVYLGRKDDQIKLHGQRISITGLSSILAQSALVKHAYLHVPKMGHLADSLVCVLSLTSSTDGIDGVLAVPESTLALQDTIQQLRSNMAGTLASYMVPSVWIPVHDLPLSSSGKIDGVRIRRWLEQEYSPSSIPTTGDDVIELPMAKPGMEVNVRACWANILGIEPTSLRSNTSFFAVGGNSLKAMALTSALRKLGIILPVSDILRRPLLGEMAAIASSISDERSDDSEDVSLPNAPREDIAEQCRVSVDDIQDIYPAAPIQEALLTLTTMDPGAYIVHRKFFLPDDVDVTKMHSAWLKTCDANPILRTKLVHLKDHGTVQVVLNSGLACLEKEDRDPETDFGWGFGKTLARASFSGRTMTLSLHHAIYDGWSMSLILRDLEQAYREDDISLRRPSFKTFINYICGVGHQESEAFWKTMLLTSAAATFPQISDRSRQVSCMQSVRRTISVPLGNAGVDVPPATIATASWAIVLSKYTGLSDVCFGLITSGRLIQLEKAQDIIGPLIATMPCRLQVDAQSSISTLLRNVQDLLVQMIPHAHYGLQQVQQISPEMKRAAAFNNTFVVHIQDEETLQSSSLLRPEEVDEVNPADFRTYPLHMACTLQGSGLEAKVTFDPAFVSEIQASRLMAYFADVLGTLAIGDRSISLRNAIKPLARPQGERIPKAVELCVHNMFDSMAKEQFNAPAICSLDAEVSYSQLQSMSDCLASHLISLGVEKEDRVCFSFEKGAIPIVAMLAIMKAGGACVPLDISYPLERVKTIVKKCRPHIILCSAQQAVKLEEMDHLNIVTLDLDTIAGLPESEASSLPSIKAHQPCYVLFTSGSTGEPKGVVWVHRTLSSSSMAHGKAMHMDRSSRVFQFSAFMWDISVCETITTLLHGGCICVPTEEERFDNPVEAMNRMKVNWAWSTPSLARSIPLGDAKHLRTLVLGGEIIGQDNIERYRHRFRLLTGYGPTECCVVCSVADFTNDNCLRNGNIGPGVGSKLWIVDSNDPDFLLPDGAPGEILIEGPIVARGYLEDGPRTAAAFVENLEWAKSGQDGRSRRFYCSGDLGQVADDGSIVFLGRKDEQVKVRGQRLELGEVEHHVLRCEGVHHALAFVPSTGPHQGRLVCVVSKEEIRDQSHQSEGLLEAVDDPRKIHDIQRSLGSWMPPFAVPSVWLVVRSMPLTPARKLDRNRVRQWALETLQRSSTAYDRSQSDPEEDIIAPTTSQERAMQQAWAEILNIPIEMIGKTQSFFDLGGDSIYAIRLVALLRAQHLSLTVAAVFRSPTLQDMALATSTLSGRETISMKPFSLLPSSCSLNAIKSEAAEKCNINSDTIEDIYPATPLQEAVMVLDEIYRGAYFAQLVYKAPNTLDVSRLAEAWNAVVRRHAILRSRLVHMPELGTMQVVIRDGLPFEHHPSLEQYLDTNGQEMIEPGEPMARLAVIDRYIVLTAHHAVYDGFSLPMIIEDIKTAYDTRSFPERPPFRHFIEYLGRQDGKHSRDFWSSYLAGHISSDFPRRDTLPDEVRADASSKIDIEIRPSSIQAVTLATYAQAAWALLLSIYGDKEDVCFGTTLSGRDVPLPNISSLPGPTLATVPMRYMVSKSTSTSKFIRNVQKTSLDVMEHQHFGLQHIRRLHREAAAACDFGTIFVVFPQEDDQHVSDWPLQRNVSTGYLDNFSMYPLAALFQQTRSGAEVTLNLDREVISEAQSVRILEDFKRILLILVNDKDNRPLEDMVNISAPGMSKKKRSQPDFIPRSANIDSKTMLALDEGTYLQYQAMTDVERQLQQTWAHILNVPTANIGKNSSFFQLGGDSITAMQVVSALRAKGFSLTVASLMRCKTIDRIAQHVVPVSGREQHVSNETDSGRAFALSPIQQLYASLGAFEHCFHQSLLLKCQKPINFESLRKALAVVVGRHAMLRCRFTRTGGGNSWAQTISDRTEKDIAVFMATSSSDAGFNSAMEQAHQCIDIGHGPVIAAALIKSPSGSQLFLVAHHMVIDLVSWRTLTHDLEQVINGETLPPLPSVSFQTWLESHRAEVETAAREKQICYSVPPSRMDYWGFDEGNNLIKNSVHLDFTLDAETTRLLSGPANRAFGTDTVDLLLAAVWSSFAQTFRDRTPPAIFNEIHGREPLDSSLEISSTVGWFTALQPLAVSLARSSSLTDVVAKIKDTRRSLSRSGWVAAFAQGAARSQLKDVLGGQTPVEIVFNFAGMFQQLEREDSLFQILPDFQRNDQGRDMQRLALFEFGAMISSQRLVVSLSFNRRIRQSDRVEEWMSEMKNTLTRMAVNLSQHDFQFTPGDFALAKLTDTQMKELTVYLQSHSEISDLTKDVEDVYPCVSVADYFLLNQRQHPKCHNVSWTLKLTALPGQSPLDPARLLEAWTRVVSRHHVLRTVFFHLPTDNSFHQQVVLRDCVIRSFCLESTENAARAIEEYPILLYKEDEVQHSFGVCATPDGDVYCRLEINHACIDGAGLGVLWRDITAAYFGQLSTEPAPSFSDYVAFMQRQPLKANTEYWCDFLQNARPGMLPLGPEPKEGLSGHAFVDISSAVDPFALHEFCRKHDVTVSAVLLTAWGLLVASRTGGISGCFLYANSGREIEVKGITEMVGPVLTGLACWMPLRTDNESFLSLVDRVQEDHYNHLQHQHFDLASVRPPLGELANTAVSIQNLTSLLPGPESGMQFEHVHAIEFPSEDFLFSGSYSTEKLSLLIKYHCSKTTTEHADGLGEDLARLLNAIMTHPSEGYSEFIRTVEN